MFQVSHTLKFLRKYPKLQERNFRGGCNAVQQTCLLGMPEKTSLRVPAEQPRLKPTPILQDLASPGMTSGEAY